MIWLSSDFSHDLLDCDLQGLPLHFCKKHLPHRDEMVTLVDEAGEEHLTKYLGDKNGLSGGWRGFAIDHDLVDGDALVFQLIKPTVFKVISSQSRSPWTVSFQHLRDSSKGFSAAFVTIWMVLVRWWFACESVLMTCYGISIHRFAIRFCPKAFWCLLHDRSLVLEICLNFK